MENTSEIIKTSKSVVLIICVKTTKSYIDKIKNLSKRFENIADIIKDEMLDFDMKIYKIENLLI